VDRILGHFQAKRLTQARQAKKWTMTDLAKRVGVTRQAISSFENDDTNPKPAVLSSLARELEVPEAFFLESLRPSEQSLESALNFRTLKASKKKARLQAKTYLQWLVSLRDFVSHYITLPDIDIPNFSTENVLELSDFDIEQIAKDTRRYFGLGDGPIANLNLLLENKGVLIGHVPLESGMDGVSAWFDGVPTILINSDAYHARARFDLAHELFHLIAHRSVTEEQLEQREFLNKIEEQAHTFAGAFLAPNNTFLKEVYRIDYDSLLKLKARWGISVQAMVVRLSQLDIISEYQKSRFFRLLNAEGLRKKEGLDEETPPERPDLFKKIVEFMQNENVLSIGDFMHSTRIPAWFVESVSGVKAPELDSVPNNVVEFKPYLKAL